MGSWDFFLDISWLIDSEQYKSFHTGMDLNADVQAIPLLKHYWLKLKHGDVAWKVFIKNCNTCLFVLVSY